MSSRHRPTAVEIERRNLRMLSVWNAGGVGRAALASRFALGRSDVTRILKDLAAAGHQVRESDPRVREI